MVQALLLFGALLACGLFFVSCAVLRVPLLATQRAMVSAARRQRKHATSIEVLLLGAATKLSHYIHLNEYRRLRMQRILRAAGFAMTPEAYQTYAVLKSGAILLGIVPCLVVLPLLSPVLLLLGIVVYFREIDRADKALEQKRSKLERELPRFVATLEQSLRSSRDLLTMLETYKKHAGYTFAAELAVLTADMRSSSYEAALTRFESRITSPMLSDVVRGMIGVLRGDDSAVYFQMLSHDLKQLELQRLKAEAQKIPPKLRVHSFVMLACFMFTWLAVIGYEIMRAITGMF